MAATAAWMTQWSVSCVLSEHSLPVAARELVSERPPQHVIASIETAKTSTQQSTQQSMQHDVTHVTCAYTFEIQGGACTSNRL